MCGIAGILQFDPSRTASREELARMVDSLVHRGPDGEGYHFEGPVALGMRRLAVIDLDTGQQPMSNEDGSAWVVLNGEIYNFPELRVRLEAKGHRFRTRSDTEVLLHLYEEEGDGFLESLNGMFAFALWDRRHRKLLLARDRIGVKPLHYALLPDRLVFASEIKALLPAGVPRDLDSQALHHYLSLGYVPAPRSIFKAVKKLEAGHVLVAKGSACTVRRYWDLPTEENIEPGQGRSGGRIEGEARALLADAVRIRLSSDVPLGTFLSGGLDSSSIVALWSRIGAGPRKTFSIGFADPSYDELPQARRIANRFDTEHHESVVSPDIRELLPVLQRHLDEPFADSSVVPTYCVSRMARRDVTVALSGDGGDEVFAGYYTYQADRLLSLYGRVPGILRKRVVPWIVDKMPRSERKVSWDFKLRRFSRGGAYPPDRAHYAWKEWFSEEDKAALYADPGEPLEPTFSVFERHYARYRGQDPLNRHLYVDAKVSLPDDMLVKVDRMSMAASLEVRSPFLDYRLVEFLAKMPGAVKMPGLALKGFLKRIMKPHLPPETLRVKKQGFSVPLGVWLRKDLRDVVAHSLSPARLARQGAFSEKTVSRMVGEHLGGKRDWSRNLWILLMFSLWHEQYARAPGSGSPGLSVHRAGGGSGLPAGGRKEIEA